MLEKHIDMAVVGKSYLSFMLSLKLLEKGQSVLILDDKRVKFGELYTNNLTTLEKAYLETWGVESQVEPLINLERYLRQTPVNFIVGSKRIKLGGTPSRNLREIVRKFPALSLLDNNSVIKKIISEKEAAKLFDEQFINYCEALSKSAYLSAGSRNIGLPFFLDFCFKELKAVYEIIKEALSSESIRVDFDTWDLKTFLFSAKGIFHKKLTLQLEDVELFHLILSLLSPHYELSNEELLDEIVPAFEERGGVFRNTEIREWSFYKNRPWSMELASYEGIIHPKKMSILGSYPSNIPLSLTPQASSYCSIKVSWKFMTKLDGLIPNEAIIHTDVRSLGTNRPLWSATTTEDGIDFIVFVIKEEGLKISFIQDEIRQMIKADLLPLYPGINDVVIEEHMEFGHDHLTMDNGKSNNSKSLKIELVDSSDPVNHKKLKNVDYYGPYKESKLGIFSSMINMKALDKGI